MDYLQISAMAFEPLPGTQLLPSAECNFEISLDNGEFQALSRSGAEPACILLPSTPRPLPVTVRAKPTTDKHFPYNGKFSYVGNGNLVRVDAAPEFRPPRSFSLRKADKVPITDDAVITLVFYLSRVNDQTDAAVFYINQVPHDRVKKIPPVAKGASAQGWLNDWSAFSPGSVNYIAATPVSGGSLQFEQSNVTLESDNLVLRLAGNKVPQFIAVNWPHALTRTLASKSTPFVVYFHAGQAQNAGKNYVGVGQKPYPIGFDYIFYSLWRYMNYQQDPLTGENEVGPRTKGLPYQVAASEKDLVTVLPQSTATGEEVGVFKSAESMHDILREIEAFMYRRAGIYVPPGLGRTALASFSSGNDLVRGFLNDSSNKGQPFYQNILKEVYGFDPPDNHVTDWTEAALKWAGTGDSSDKVVQIYARGVHDGLSNVLGTNLSRAPFVQDSRSGLRTVGVLPTQYWASHRKQPTGWQETHQLISAMMLTAALRRSKFE